MALETLTVEEAADVSQVLARSIPHAVDATLGRRIQAETRRKIEQYFDALDEALPWHELEMMLAVEVGKQQDRANRGESMTAAERQALRDRVQAVLAPTVDAFSPDLIDIIFSGSLYGYYAAVQRTRLDPPRPPRDGEREFSEADTGTAPEIDQPESVIMGWLAAQSESVERVAERVRSNAAVKVVGMDGTTKKRLAGLVARGVERGKDVPEIARRIRKDFPTMKRNRARLIALNETNEAMSLGAETTAKRQNADEKNWQTMGDDRVTLGCQENGAQDWIGMDENFPNGPNSHRPPRFPGCRCAVLYRGGDVPPPPAGPIDEITPSMLDEALRRVVGRLPAHTYTNGIKVPAVQITQADLAALAARQMELKPVAGGIIVGDSVAAALVRELEALKATGKIRPLTGSENHRVLEIEAELEKVAN
jgi:hypothetical protein